MEITTPEGWKESDPTVVMVHGLCGDHFSPYMVRLANRLSDVGIRSIRINLRGCGTARGHSRKMYAPDSSDDIWKALEEIKRDTPYSPLTLAGFSLGGNIVLKMAGERGAAAEILLEQVIAVNPPIDLYSSVALLSAEKIYDNHFMKYLREDLDFRHSYYDDLPPIELPRKMTTMEFDEFYLAPQAGYDSVTEYFRASSCGPHIPHIEVPCKILISKDDPIVDYTLFEPVPFPEKVELVMTEKGGHLGYLALPSKESGVRWMDDLFMKWVG